MTSSRPRKGIAFGAIVYREAQPKVIAKAIAPLSPGGGAMAALTQVSE